MSINTPRYSNQQRLEKASFLISNQPPSCKHSNKNRSMSIKESYFLNLYKSDGIADTPIWRSIYLAGAEWLDSSTSWNTLGELVDSVCKFDRLSEDKLMATLKPLEREIWMQA